MWTLLSKLISHMITNDDDESLHFLNFFRMKVNYIKFNLSLFLWNNVIFTNFSILFNHHSKRERKNEYILYSIFYTTSILVSISCG